MKNECSKFYGEKHDIERYRFDMRGQKCLKMSHEGSKCSIFELEGSKISQNESKSLICHVNRHSLRFTVRNALKNVPDSTNTGSVM